MRVFDFLGQSLLTAGALSLAACATQPVPEVIVLVDDGSASGVVRPVDFKTDIAPLLQAKCLSCHHDEGPLTDLSFQRRTGLLVENAGRPVLVPGEPEKSTLFLVTVMPDYFVEAMPPTGHRLADEEAADLYHWILQGAEWPDQLALKRPPDA